MRRYQYAMLSACLVGSMACNDHIFEAVETCQTESLSEAKPRPEEQALDILLVVDNSGSMSQEQAKLASQFSNPACPASNVANLDAAACAANPLCRPTRDVFDAQLKDNCGFIDILNAYQADYRLGLLTTDISKCDLGSHPDNPSSRKGCDEINFTQTATTQAFQRGCLQSQALGGLYIDRSTADVQNKFTQQMNLIGIHGAPVEAGLEATRLFLEGTAAPGSGCENHAQEFLRPGSKLLIIYLTDEEDCSFDAAKFEARFAEFSSTSFCADGLDGPCYEYPREVDLKCDGTDIPSFSFGQGSGPANKALCYDNPELLIPTTEYIRYFNEFENHEVQLAVIGGGGPSATGEFLTSTGCFIGADGQPNTDCTALKGSNGTVVSEGYNNQTADTPDKCEYPSSSLCHEKLLPNNTASGEHCCLADATTRYYEVMQGVGSNGIPGSICNESFGQTLAEIARAGAEFDFVQLTEPVENEALVSVFIRKDSSSDLVTVPQCTTDPCLSGWDLLDDRVRVQLYGAEFIPEAGGEIIVNAAPEGLNSEQECVGVLPGQQI